MKKNKSLAIINFRASLKVAAMIFIVLMLPNITIANNKGIVNNIVDGKAKMVNSNTGTDNDDVDLDGDGKADRVNLDTNKGVLNINNTSLKVNLSDIYLEHNIIDIDKSDNLKEIYIQRQGTDVYIFNDFYIYQNGKIRLIGSCEGLPDADGSGKIVFSNVVSQFFETHFYDSIFELDKNHILKEIIKDSYAIKVPEGTEDNIIENHKATVKKFLQIREEKASSKISADLVPGEKVKIIACDEKRWVLVENSKGVKGWFEVDDNNIIRDLQLKSYDVFEGLFFAG